MLNKSKAEFAELYVKLLERRGGVKYFAQRLAELATGASVDQLILCCFEDIRKPGPFCHRRVFAEWWDSQTGEVIEELPDGPEQLEL